MKINKLLLMFLLFITLSFQNFAEDADGGKDKNQESKTEISEKKEVKTEDAGKKDAGAKTGNKDKQKVQEKSEKSKSSSNMSNKGFPAKTEKADSTNDNSKKQEIKEKESLDMLREYLEKSDQRYSEYDLKLKNLEEAIEIFKKKKINLEDKIISLNNKLIILIIVFIILILIIILITCVILLMRPKTQRGYSTDADRVRSLNHIENSETAKLKNENSHRQIFLSDIQRSSSVSVKRPAEPLKPISSVDEITPLYQSKELREQRMNKSKGDIFLVISKAVFEHKYRGCKISLSSIILEEGGSRVSAMFILTKDMNLFLNFHLYNEAKELKGLTKDIEDILKMIYQVEGNIQGFVKKCLPAKVSKVGNTYEIVETGKLLIST